MSTDISDLKTLAGFIGACLVDSETGLMLASETSGVPFDLEAAGAANTEVVRAKNAAMRALGLEDKIEDILITLGTQYHLIRPLTANPAVFVYLAVDRKTANLGMARLALKNAEGTLRV
ncbi:roadblock/LC7 domain-containing protein [Marinibacterium sp. SX1]|uniref:roadblock/LC7 domain-containing protein n=1 Tax=Marinibacterium sp. SX1 TaxID=3388424 RepID=UPI003D17E20A